MILSDRSIIARLRAGDLEIAPLDDPGIQIQPCSVDLRLKPDILIARRGDEGAIRWLTSTLEGQPWLYPGQFVLGGTVERVKLPHDLVARVDGRSSWGRRGLLVHITAGLVDPGFNGQITLEILNIGPDKLRLDPGVRICQLVIEHLDAPALRPYGANRNSTYSGIQPAPVAPPPFEVPRPPSGLSLESLWQRSMGAPEGQ